MEDRKSLQELMGLTDAERKEIRFVMNRSSNVLEPMKTLAHWAANEGLIVDYGNWLSKSFQQIGEL